MHPRFHRFPPVFSEKRLDLKSLEVPRWVIFTDREFYLVRHLSDSIHCEKLIKAAKRRPAEELINKYDRPRMAIMVAE